MNLPPEGPGTGLANPSQGSWKLAIVWVFLEPIEVRKFIHTQKRKKKKQDHYFSSLLLLLQCKVSDLLLW